MKQHPDAEADSLGPSRNRKIVDVGVIVDGTLLNTDVAGGFVGAVVGPHARIAPNEQNGAGK